MKKTILLLVFFLTTKLLFAHDCLPQLAKCPIDNTEVKFCVYGPSAAFGIFTDFQLKVDIDDYYEVQIKSCPKCHFSGFLADFKVVYNDKEKSEIKGFLSKYNSIAIDDVKECQIAGELKEFQKESNDKIGNCFLIGSYILKIRPNKMEIRKELQNKARHYFMKAVADKEYKNPNELASINYLIAEMYRRTADFKNAIKFYNVVVKNPKKSPWIEEMVVIQKELAVKKNEINTI
ncbi:hypothetical protein SAMN05443549_10758 [Flavobacterium fluvii]|uniref:Tetratricopeptide repeat-containing protein n=1 Tax=Flavobacterium fluvii TaxID=468056 RepID=A0A1M5MZJ7_9FLAO|nr:DUF2225 domain-containing protein [Flavobacterium fluvii]SHG82744.1 hypothetical protein SAMN05443549_10758 [Flavobacterium fluvii]